MKFIFIVFLFISLSSVAQNKWFDKTTIYQVYPRSFKDTDGDGIGDIKGIISKLGYIKSLGYETIWVSPFYDSPQADFGYDISDYKNADPVYGTNKDIDNLISETHKHGLKIIFDLVLNHTSDKHPWFIESKSDTSNPKRDWYIWKNGRKKNKAPNNWINSFNKEAWHYIPERNQYYYTAFLSFQPDLNWRNPEVKKAMFDIVRYWLNKGVDGFRLDIFNCILEDKNFSNNPFKFHLLPSRDGMIAKRQIKTNNINHPDNILLAKELRAVINEYDNPKRFLIGEAIGPIEKIKPLVGENRDGLNFVFLFDMIFYDFKASFFRNKIIEFEEHFPAPLKPTIVFGNHDNYRSTKRIDNKIEKAKLLTLFQLTTRGTPVTYYGEEVGMENAKIKKKDALDPISHEFNRIPKFVRNWVPVPVNRDVSRTPMQWSASQNGGFSSSDSTWLPLSTDIERRNVQSQSIDTNSLLNTYTSILEIRNNSTVLQEGQIELIDKKLLPKNVLGYHRMLNGDRILVLFNFSKRTKSFVLSSYDYEVIYRVNKQDDASYKQATLSPYGGLILK